MTPISDNQKSQKTFKQIISDLNEIEKKLISKSDRIVKTDETQLEKIKNFLLLFQFKKRICIKNLVLFVHLY